MLHSARSTLPLVRSTDAQIQSLVGERLRLYESIRETATPTDPIVTFGSFPPSGQPPSAKSSTGVPSPSSIDYASPITPGSGVANITCSLPSEVTDAWHNPWFMSSQEDNDEALKAFIKQPVSPEMISYLAIKTEQILELPEPNEVELQHQVEPQWPPLRHFIATIVSKAEVRTGALMSTLVYLERFRKLLGPGVKATVGIASHHRIFFACLILTCKYLHDSNLKNRCWAKCSIVSDWLCRSSDPSKSFPFQLKTNDVNLMEKEMLARLNWSLAITENDLYSHLDFFLAPIRGRNQTARLLAEKTAALQKSAVNQIRTAVSTEQLNSWHYPTVLPVPHVQNGLNALTERTPSLSPPGLIPSSAASSRRTQHSLATPASVSTNATTPLSTKRRSLLHCRSLVSLSSISPIGKTRKSASGVGLNKQMNNSSSNLLRPSDNAHPYATYGRGSKPLTKHSHTHSTASTVSTLSNNEPGSRLSLNQSVPQFAQGMFRPQSSYSTLGSNRASWLGGSAGRHPHIRQSSGVMDQNMFETVIDIEPDTAISEKMEAGQAQPGLHYSLPMMGVPSVQRPGPGPIQPSSSPTPAQQTTDVKSSRMSSFWSRLMAAGLGRA